MHTIRLFVLAAGLMACTSAFADGSKEGPVWHWFSQCSQGKKVEIQIILDRKPIFDSEFPACPMQRSEIKPDPKQKILVFTLPQSGNHYLGAPSTEKIEGNIWEAGSDPNDILLGLSFAGPKRVWLNTLHIAKMSGTYESQQAKGIVSKTIIKYSP